MHPSHTPCDPPRPPLGLDAPSCALELACATFDDAPEAGIVVLVEQPGGGGIALAIETDGRATTAEAVEAVSRLLGRLPAAERRRVVVATRRDGVPLAIEEHELDAWRSLRDRVRDLPIDLLDWFVLRDDHALSLAELTAPPTAWHRRT